MALVARHATTRPGDGLSQRQEEGVGQEKGVVSDTTRRPSRRRVQTLKMQERGTGKPNRADQADFGQVNRCDGPGICVCKKGGVYIACFPLPPRHARPPPKGTPGGIARTQSLSPHVLPFSPPIRSNTKNQETERRCRTLISSWLPIIRTLSSQLAPFFAVPDHLLQTFSSYRPKCGEPCCAHVSEAINHRVRIAYSSSFLFSPRHCAANTNHHRLLPSSFFGASISCPNLVLSFSLSRLFLVFPVEQVFTVQLTGPPELVDPPPRCCHTSCSTKQE